MPDNESSSPVCYADTVGLSLPAESLRILILGMGAVGGYVGARLLEAGADVTFLVREQRLQSPADNRLHVNSPLGSLRQEPRLVSTNTTSGSYDLVILACKAFDLPAATAALKAVIDDDTRLLPLLNGLRHLDLLDTHYGRKRVLAGFAHMAVEKHADGTIEHLNDFHRVVYGIRHPQQQTCAERLKQVFDGSRLDVEFTALIEQALWDKFIFLATLAGATCLLRGTISDIMASCAGKRFILNLLEECITIANAEGHALPTATLTDYRALLTDPHAAYSASMLRDLQAGRRSEAEHILGDMSARAARHQIAAPNLELAYSALQVYEQQFNQKWTSPSS